MTDAKPIVPPTIVGADHTANTFLFLAEPWASGISPSTPLTYEIDRGLGTEYQATIKDGDGRVVITERLDIRPTINAWITDLLNRAEKASKQ